ncbi:class I SAM-dependent methyltransferase [Streptomyces sp. SCL15-4]|uniref:class I SAM-dependent methyltransferase n=1 Tax=Streptomyces sp. SCL15-4 TaxID=2967221 RepID=UPI002967665B|nr:class I SAM-dependent methyltransferase [Streptomyces sp. SCL15-4]
MTEGNHRAPDAANRTPAAVMSDALGLGVSPVMVEPAARQVPGAGFRLAGIRGTALAEASVDAVCACFSLLQMSRAEQAAVIAQPARAVRPGGLVALATVPLDAEDPTASSGDSRPGWPASVRGRSATW